MGLKIEALREPPPPERYRTGMIMPAEARAALRLLESQEWVSEAGTCRTRPSAAARAKRMITHMLEIEPDGKFTSKTWPDGKRFRWAVRRKAAE